jgi:hypothetical protein
MSENMTFLPKKELMTLEELDRMVSAFVRLGVRKLRITDGEPLVRRDIMTFFRSMSRHLETGALKEFTLTTNGSQLEKFADSLLRLVCAGSTSRLIRSMTKSLAISPVGVDCRKCCAALMPPKRQGCASR